MTTAPTALTRDAIEARLRQIPDPCRELDLLSCGAVQDISISPTKTGSKVEVLYRALHNAGEGSWVSWRQR